MVRFVVATCATHECGYLKSLSESCSKQDYEFHIFGFGMEWKGFMWGVQMVLDGLNSLGLQEDDLVLVVDGFDCLMCMNSSSLHEIYLQFCIQEGKDIVVIGKEHPKEESSFLHKLTVRKISQRLYDGGFGTDSDTLNTGSVLGSWKVMSSFIDSLIQFSKWKEIDDDQVCVNRYFLQEKPDVPLKVDEDSIFFCYCERNMIFLIIFFLWNRNKLKHVSNTISFNKDGKLIRVKKDVQVAVLHGIWNTDMDWVCKEMGLSHRKESSYLKPFSQIHLRKTSDLFVKAFHLLATSATFYFVWDIVHRIHF